MNTIYKYLSLFSILAIAVSTQAQTEEEVIVDTKNVKIIVKEKKVITTGKDGKDSVVSETTERIVMQPGAEGEETEEIEEIEVEGVGDDFETAYEVIKVKKGDDDSEEYVVVVDGDTIDSQSPLNHVIRVIKEVEEEVEMADDEAGEAFEFAEALELELMDMFEDKEEEIPFVETDWFNLQWGFTNLLNANDKLEMPSGSEMLALNPGNSANFQVHVVQQALNLYKGKVRLIYGVGIDWNNYRFKNDVDLIDTGGISWVASANEYKKNKLVTRFLTVPVMLDFNIGKQNNDGFKIAFGTNFGYNLGSHQKQKWGDDNGKHKVKTREDYGVEQFRMGYEVQFGYGSFILYGKYFPKSVFKDGLGPDVRTVSAGILIGHI